jgi:hypothetical protein
VCGRDTALNRLAIDAYQWDAYERTSFGHQLSNRCRWAGLDVAHYRHLLRLTDKQPRGMPPRDSCRVRWRVQSCGQYQWCFNSLGFHGAVDTVNQSHVPC